MTQTAQVKKHLQAGKTITPLEALRKYGIMRLGARIWELRHNEKMTIHSHLVERNGKRFAEYSTIPFYAQTYQS